MQNYNFYGSKTADAEPIDDKMKVKNPKDIIVYGIERPGGNFHCYNDVEGCIFDLTSEQFGDEAKGLVNLEAEQSGYLKMNAS